MIQPILRLALVLLAAPMLACISPSDPLGRVETLQELQRKYTELIRWGEVERAVQYVDPEQHEAFLAIADEFEELRITDYEVGELDIRGGFHVDTNRSPEEGDVATVDITVIYKGYVISQMIERSFRETQQWYRDSVSNTWRVRPDLDGLLDGIHGRKDQARNAGVPRARRP